MKAFFDFDRFEAIDEVSFRGQKPFPFLNPAGLLAPGAWEELEAQLPPVELFEEKFGKKRHGGQMPHDRYSLEYTSNAAVPAPWQEFIAELCSDRYRKILARLFDARKINLRFHWHYTPNGCSVSPHTDSVREHGSQLFYFNSEDEWDPAWGGDTLVLDDGGRLKFESAPSFEDFKNEIAAKSIGNYSLIFKRTPRSWHAVREIQCPEDHLRRVFIVVVNPENLYRTIRDRVMGKKVQRF